MRPTMGSTFAYSPFLRTLGYAGHTYADRARRHRANRSACQTDRSCARDGVTVPPQVLVRLFGFCINRPEGNGSVKARPVSAIELDSRW